MKTLITGFLWNDQSFRTHLFNRSVVDIASVRSKNINQISLYRPSRRTHQTKKHNSRCEETLLTNPQNKSKALNEISFIWGLEFIDILQ